MTMTYPFNFMGPARWQTVSETTLDADKGAFAQYTFRVVIEAAEYSVSGNKIRLTFESATTGTGLKVDDVYVGHQAASGDPYDFESSPTEVLFSASSGFDIALSTTITSDDTSFAFDASKDLVVAFHVDSGATGDDDMREKTTVTNYETYLKSVGASSDAATVDATGYTADADCICLTKLEVFG